MDEKHSSDTNEKKSSSEHIERASVHSGQTDEKPFDETRQINQKLANPLAGRSHDRLISEGEAFASKYGMEDLTEEFRKGALLAQDPSAFDKLDILTEEDKADLRKEITHKWSQPGRLYALVICCSVAAAVQGVRSLP